MWFFFQCLTQLLDPTRITQWAQTLLVTLEDSVTLYDCFFLIIGTAVCPIVEFPKSEVRGRAENRSSTVARPSTGGASSGKFAPPRSPESLKACRGPARLLHPLPRDSSSSPAPADFSLTRPNQLGSCNETLNISSRIY